ncbi:ABC transporter family protein [Trichomonas vaginalis G3]|uniref:ABC transporter family protein n=1 Tax=Trichomonas vaginalis (strain ATCC PRA-98 / G3) TaxID=412133 RepID=A2FIU8_TRIV3|nr:ABC transporter type 1, transmembrane domain domain-containing protein [Trichomonas vaginalis G3]EAX95163.1 ABC transporter family protein [Trichomonas vaginalis G3]KAI5514515.1 ABC transporter type 1, transmembrane domain domain-containing protein [Trichomonas vaginalis G3]|eukprot:XP_001308093.1 ABC transporter family protein [Trichomonas vaginalis G3]
MFPNRSTHRSSSEYSTRRSSEYSLSEQIKVQDDDTKMAKGTLYKMAFGSCKNVLAIIPSFISGGGTILTFFLFGKLLNQLTFYSMDPNPNAYDKCLKYIYGMIGTSCGSALCKFFDQYAWIRIGAEVSGRIRRDLFRSMMQNDVTFFDTNPIGGILTLLSEDSQQVQQAFGTEKGTQISNLAQFITGIVFAYVYSWKLALIATAIIPVAGIFMAFFMPAVIKEASRRFLSLSKSMTIAEETLSSVRTVRGFNREEDEIVRFEKSQYETIKSERRIGFLMSGMGSIIMILLWAMVLGNLYYGTHLVQNSLRSDGTFGFGLGDLMSCWGYCMFGRMGILMLQGSLQGEQRAIAAGARIFKLTNSPPSVPFDGGIEPDNFVGEIEFKNVTFRYPTRPVNVLNNVSFKIRSGEIAALVGHYGSGKSTCVQLLERYYDVTEGLILLDGRDIKEYNPRWLHHKIGLVGQEPTLFSTTIKNNILYGVETATDSQIDTAADIANAKKFIEKLDKKYDTLVGDRGGQLSGGQRQRIAIARAVIKNPRILICDEAISALDAESEKKVQAALDNVLIGRTGVIVAHRLSTIKNANIIYVFDAGVIVEQGTHNELVQKGGFYYKLVSRQLTQKDIMKGSEAAKKNNANSAAGNNISDTSNPQNKPVQPLPDPVKKDEKKKENKNEMKKDKKKKETSDSDSGINSSTTNSEKTRLLLPAYSF